MSVEARNPWGDYEPVPQSPEGERAVLNKINGMIVNERLTERESEVARLVLQGLGNKTIARELGVQVGTVKIHLHHIYRKLGVPNRRVFLFNTLSGSAQL